jgi:hypothetical protein
MELADGVAGLEVGQPKADEDVRPADDEDPEVQQVENAATTSSVARISACSRRSIGLALAARVWSMR